MRKIIILLFIILWKVLPSYCQSQTEMPDSLKTTVIIFDDNGNSGYTTTTKNGKKTVKKRKSFPKNTIKLGLFGPAYGEVQFYYERYLTDWFTVQGGVGLATRDFLGDLYVEGFGHARYKGNNNWTGPNEVDEYDNFDITYPYRKAGIGFCASVAPRFYPAAEAFDGFYLSPVFQYAMRNNKVQKVDTDGNRMPNNKMTEKSSNIYFYLNIGGQRNFEPVTLDFSVSLGMWKYIATRQDIGYTEDPLTFTRVYGNKELTYSKILPYFRLNLDLGGVFGK